MATTSPARSCTRAGCRRRTTDASGACHDHRGAVSARSSVPPGIPKSVAPFYETRTTVTHRNIVGGAFRAEEHFFPGTQVLHRTDGPAKRIYDPVDGRVIADYYFLHGDRHRIDGPSSVEYRPDGSVIETSSEWHFRGDRVKTREALVARLQATPRGRRTSLLTASPYRELLDEGISAETVIETLATGVSTPAGVREVLGGAPPEWVRSFEERVDSSPQKVDTEAVLARLER